MLLRWLIQATNAYCNHEPWKLDIVVEMILCRPRSFSSQCTIYYSNSAAGGDDPPNLTGDSCQDKFNVTGLHRNYDPKPLTLSLFKRFWHFAFAQRPAVIASIISSMVVLSIFLFQLHVSIREYQGPLDHVTTSLWETYYGMFCADFSSDGNQPSNSTNEYSNTISWDYNINSKSLSTYPNNPGFFIVEDDAVLKNPNAFEQKVCNAHHHEMKL